MGLDSTAFFFLFFFGLPKINTHSFFLESNLNKTQTILFFFYLKTKKKNVVIALSKQGMQPNASMPRKQVLANVHSTPKRSRTRKLAPLLLLDGTETATHLPPHPIHCFPRQVPQIPPIISLFGVQHSPAIAIAAVAVRELYVWAVQYERDSDRVHHFVGDFGQHRDERVHWSRFVKVSLYVHKVLKKK
jgi:hypothetical protein